MSQFGKSSSLERKHQGFESCLDKEGIIWTSMGQMKVVWMDGCGDKKIVNLIKCPRKITKGAYKYKKYYFYLYEDLERLIKQIKELIHSD